MIFLWWGNIPPNEGGVTALWPNTRTYYDRNQIGGGSFVYRLGEAGCSSPARSLSQEHPDLTANLGPEVSRYF